MEGIFEFVKVSLRNMGTLKSNFHYTRDILGPNTVKIIRKFLFPPPVSFSPLRFPFMPLNKNFVK
jgi:hypothetical protein